MDISKPIQQGHNGNIIHNQRLGHKDLYETKRKKQAPLQTNTHRCYTMGMMRKQLHTTEKLPSSNQRQVTNVCINPVTLT